jgi:hypothetical protein
MQQKEEEVANLKLVKVNTLLVNIANFAIHVINVEGVKKRAS